MLKPCHPSKLQWTLAMDQGMASKTISYGDRIPRWPSVMYTVAKDGTWDFGEIGDLLSGKNHFKWPRAFIYIIFWRHHQWILGKVSPKMAALLRQTFRAVQPTINAIAMRGLLPRAATTAALHCQLPPERSQQRNFNVLSRNNKVILLHCIIRRVSILHAPRVHHHTDNTSGSSALNGWRSRRKLTVTCICRCILHAVYMNYVKGHVCFESTFVDTVQEAVVFHWNDDAENVSCESALYC
jgi:hypothetical protein